MNFKNILYFILISTFIGFYSCAKDDIIGDKPSPDDSQKEKIDSPKSVVINAANISMPVSGTITVQYSDSPAGNGIEKIVDNNPYSKFSIESEKVWMVWKSDEAFIATDYFITSADGSSENDPKSWTLSASIDSVTWTTLDTKNDFIFTERKSKKKFSINDKIPYLYFKLDITSNNGGDLTQVAEWGLKKPISMEDLIRFASGFSASSQTTMGKHYENRHVTTDSDKSWLLDANNEPPAPGSLNNGAEWKELPVTLYPFGEPVPTDINQHDIGDCGGIAALASMAYLYPDFIKSIITDNGNQTYTIDMFDPQGKPIKLTVSSTFLVRKDNKRIAAVSSKSDKACWSTILEKAIMKYNVIYKVNPDIGGIGSEHVPPLLTGDGGSFAFSPGVLNNEQLKRAVEASLDEGKLVIGGFNQVVQFGNTKTVTGHAFTFMYSTDSNALFTMRNPWGFNPNTDGKDDGVLHIPDNGYIPPLIDLRIVNPGKAISMKKDIEPYIPPIFSSVNHELRVSPALMASGM